MKEATKKSFDEAMAVLGRDMKMEYMKLAYGDNHSGIDSAIPLSMVDSLPLNDRGYPDTFHFVTDCTTSNYVVKDLRDMITEDIAQGIIALAPLYSNIMKGITEKSIEEQENIYKDFCDTYEKYFP